MSNFVVGSWRGWVLEPAVLVAAALGYARPLLDFSPNLMPPGADIDTNLAVLEGARRTWLELGYLPLWNGYFGSGQPLAGDPLNALFNPLLLFPVLLLGAVNGAKVALTLSVILTGLAQYLLGRIVGLPAALRLWSAVTLMLSGSLAARLAAGHLQTTLAFPWIPLWLAGLLICSRGGRPLAPLLAAFPMAMVLLSGDFYYFSYMAALSIALGAGLSAIRWARGERRLAYLGALASTTLAVLLATGLAGAKLLPALELAGRFARNIDPFAGSPPLYTSLLTFAMPRSWFDSAPLLQSLGITFYTWAEYYSYLGPTSLAFLMTLPLALRRNPLWRPAAGLLGLLFLLALLWSTAGHVYSPWTYAYGLLPGLAQFRVPSRVLAIAAVALVTLASIGAAGALGFSYFERRRPAWRAAWTIAVYLLLLLGPALLYRQHWFLLGPLPTDRRVSVVADDSLVGSPPGRLFLKEVNPQFVPQWSLVARGFRIINGYYGWNTRSSGPLQYAGGTGGPARELGDDEPGDWTLSPVAPGSAAEEEGSRMRPTHAIARNADALPYATVDHLEASGDGARLVREPDVRAQVTSWAPGRIEVEVGGDVRDSDVLFLLERNYPGWKVVAGDGSALELVDVGGYLGARLKPGPGRYRFVFDPILPYLGLAVTAASAVAAAVLVVLSGHWHRSVHGV